MSKLAVAALRIIRFKRQFSTPERMHALIAKDRRRKSVGPGAGLRRRARVAEAVIAGRTVWTVSPKDGGTGTKVLYFHGGSYVLDLASYHWAMVGRLVRESGATLIVPRYPLAPEAACLQTVAFARALYREVQPDVLLGDSAGGGLSVVLCQALRDAGEAQPRLLILLSPWLDVTFEDPRCAAIEPRDPMLAIPGNVEAGRLYARLTDRNDARVSPINGTFDALPPMMVFASTHDIVYPDALRLRERLPTIEWIEGTDLFHDWPLVVTLPEARAAIRQMAARINA